MSYINLKMGIFYADTLYRECPHFREATDGDCSLPSAITFLIYLYNLDIDANIVNLYTLTLITI